MVAIVECRESGRSVFSGSSHLPVLVAVVESRNDLRLAPPVNKSVTTA